MNSGAGRHRSPDDGGPAGVRGLSVVGSLGILVVVVLLVGWLVVSRLTSAAAGSPPTPSGPAPVAGTPSATSSPSPTTTAPSPSPTSTESPATITGLVLRCSLDGQQLHATLTFVSSGRVPVTLIAGDHASPQTVEAGSVELTATGAAYPATCSALVGGHAYGPIRAS